MRAFTPFPLAALPPFLPIPSRIQIWFVLIDGRSPVNRNATDNEAEKDRHIRPPAHQEMVLWSAALRISSPKCQQWNFTAW